jgi:iron complex outermembrane receptor protein
MRSRTGLARPSAVLVVPAFGLPLAAVSATPPEEPSEEVVIHASLREETLSQLPASITVLDAETLQVAGVQHLQDVLGLIPNLNWAAGTSRPRYFQLRGIGELEQFQGAPNVSVGFLIDDIDFSGIGMPATLFDTQQVEVLRGPQGTTYGANALAGLVSIRTHEPTQDLEIRGEAVAAEYGSYGAGGVIGGALGGSDSAAFRLVAQRYRSDGFRRNVFLNRDDTNGYDETTVRGKIHWEASPDLSVHLTGMWVDLDNGYDAWSIDNSRVTLSDNPGRDAQRSTGAALRLDYEGFENFRLRSITTAADSDIVYSFDGDWGNDAAWGIWAPYDYTSRFLRERQTFSQELRAISRPGRISWVAGLYWRQSDETNDQLDVGNGDASTLFSDYEATNTAAYGEVEFTLSDRTTFSVGGRVEHWDADYSDTNASAFNQSQTMFGGHVSLEYALTDDHHLYATVSRGYKAGGFNIGLEVPEDRRKFDTEYLTNFELGAKLNSADGRVQGQVALFYMRREDQQVDTSAQPDPSDPLTFVFFTDNAARGENYGLEGTLSWNVTDRVSVGTAVGVLKTRYIDYHSGDRILDGREQSHAPEYQIALAAQYRHPRGLFARMDVQSVDNFYFSASHDERSSPFTLVNVKLGWETERWGAYAWVRNLFDESYAMRGFFFGNEPPDWEPELYLQQGDPRQAGVTFTYTFR